MLHDLREIPVIDPFATLLALYEMPRPVFRDNAESHSKISWEVTHGAIDPWAVWQGYPPTARVPSPHIELHTCPSAMRGQSDWAFRNSQFVVPGPFS